MLVSSFRVNLLTAISDNADTEAYRKQSTGGCRVVTAPHTPVAASASSEDWNDSMNSREANKKRRLAHTQGLLPDTCASECTKPDGSVVATHEVELAALKRIEQGEHNAWDVLCIEALSEKCFSRGCAFDTGAIEDCPGWCRFAISGFEGWVMAS